MNVLVIDDSFLDRQIAKIVISEIPEVQVTTVAGIKQASHQITINNYDLIISDLYLEKEKGTEILHVLKTLKKDIPTVLFTARDIKTLGDLGFDMMFNKSGGMNTVKKNIQKAINLVK